MGPSPSARGIVTGPQPTPAARRWAARLHLYVGLLRALRGADLSDGLTIGSLLLIGIGLAMVAVPLALVVVGSLVGLMTPLGGAVRLFIRGR